MDKEFELKMVKLLKQIGIELKEEDVKKYFQYMKLLLEWNENINLTAITEMDDVILKHFVDSMTVLKYIDENSRLVDVGTGAGFPGIPIAIMKPDVKVTLLDSLNKRILFLNEVVEKLDLKNVKTVHGRAEDFGNDKYNRESFDIAVSRAVANLCTLVEYLLPTIKFSGKCICMKGPDAEQEIEDAKFAIKELGGKIEKVEKLTLPDSDIERTIIIIRKVKETPKNYPRKAGTPSKTPLKKASLI